MHPDINLSQMQNPFDYLKTNILNFEQIHFEILKNTYYNFWKGHQVMCAPRYQSLSDGRLHFSQKCICQRRKCDPGSILVNWI